MPYLSLELGLENKGINIAAIYNNGDYKKSCFMFLKYYVSNNQCCDRTRFLAEIITHTFRKAAQNQ